MRVVSVISGKAGFRSHHNTRLWPTPLWATPSCAFHLVPFLSFADRQHICNSRDLFPGITD